LSEKDFPEVKERLMKKGIRYYLSRNLHKKKNHKEYLSLDRVEDLISGFKQMLAYMVEDLAHNKKWNEAVGVMRRNDVENYVRQEVREELATVEYDQAKDSSLFEYDEFEPLSKPMESYMKLPEHVKVEWIGTDDDVPKLAALLEEPLIGVDSEWRPELSQYHKTRPSLFQISGKKTAFLIDLISLQRSTVLDGMLVEVFKNPKSTIIGFGFNSDIDQFASKHPHLQFIKYITNFIDAQTYYGKVYLVEQQTGLAKVAQTVFEKTVCKVE